MLHDARCTFTEIHMLPRHDRDMRKLMKYYKRSQWGGFVPPGVGTAGASAADMPKS